MGRRFAGLGLIALIMVLLELLLVVQKTGGLVYAIDDAYIHLAIARNGLNTGVWSLDPRSFTFATSSPLYTLLIGLGFRVAGIQEWFPLLLNLAGLMVGIWIISRETSFFYGLLVLLVSGLPAMILYGMETVWYAVLFWFVLKRMVHRWVDGHPLTLQEYASLGVLSGLRYETAFLTFVLVLLFAVRRRVREAVSLFLASILPYTLFGLYSHGHGGTWIPVTLWLKGMYRPHDVPMVFFRKLWVYWYSALRYSPDFWSSGHFLPHSFRASRTGTCVGAFSCGSWCRTPSGWPPGTWGRWLFSLHPYVSLI